MNTISIQLVSPTANGGLDLVRDLSQLEVADFLQQFGGLPSRMDTIYLCEPGDNVSKCYCVVRKSFDLSKGKVTIKVIDPEETSTGYSVR